MRLVDANELEKYFSPTLHGREVYNAEEILMTIQTMPTVDPLIHASWIMEEDEFGYYWVCSHCGKFSYSGKSHYCAHCGAKMDEG